MTNRITSLSVVTEGAEEWLRLFQELSELASNLGAVHQHVSVTATIMNEDDSEPECDPEGLYYDDNTLVKVISAIKKILGQTGRDETRSVDEITRDIISEMQNTGILFRERSKS